LSAPPPQAATTRAARTAASAALTGLGRIIGLLDRCVPKLWRGRVAHIGDVPALLAAAARVSPDAEPADW
jgi:hypothetical protein